MQRIFNPRLAIAIVIAVLHFLPFEIYGQNSFQLNGNGGQADLGNNCFRLTQAATNQHGSAWWRKKADLSQDFDVTANLNFGTRDAGGADGIVFAFQNVCTSSGSAGGGIGIAGVTPSVFVEFDTWQNTEYNDPAYDHVGIQKNGNVNHNSSDVLTAPVGIIASNGNVEDGTDYLVRILWTHADHTLKVYVNGDMRISYTGDIVTDVFSGSPYVYWGFTAATGGSYNVQSVCLTSIPSNTIKLSNTSICQGQSKQLSVPGAVGYSWAPNTNISATNVYNPTVSPTLTTTYYVSMTDACSNVQTDSIVVTVNPLPNVSLTLPFMQKCQSDAPVTLSGGSPVGGTFSGTAVSGSQFTPGNAGVGPLFIYYNYTDANGCTNTDSNFVLVNAPVNVTQTDFTPVCVNASAFTLTGGSPSGGSYSGTGVTGGNSFNPSTAGAGTHNIVYTYTDNNGCTGSVTKSITVNALPTAVIDTPNGTVLCSGNINLTTTAANGVSYQWLKGGNTVTTLAAGNTQYAVTAAGSYTLFASSSSGCTATSAAVTVTTGTVPTATITSATTEFCPGSSVTLSSSLTNGETIKWYSGGNLISGATGASYTANAAATYKAIITSSTGCSATSNTITLTQLPGAVATATSSLPAFCPGTTSVTLTANSVNGAQYQWLNGGTAVSGATTATYVATATGSYSVVISLNTCADTSSVITLGNAVNPEVTLTTPDSTFCSGTGALTVTATSGGNYVWYLNGNAIGGNNNNTLSVTQSGLYTVKVTNSSQCSATSAGINMMLQPLPTAAITASRNTVCSGDTVVLTATPVAGATYQWTKDGTALGVATTTNSYATTQGGTYNCIVDNGCSATSNAVSITVSTVPGAAASIFGGTTSPCIGDFDMYSINPVSGATSYTWSVSPANGAFMQDGQGTTSAVITFLNADVTISVVANNDCGSGPATSQALSINTIPYCNGTAVAFGAAPSHTCTGSAVTFYNYSDDNSVSGLSPVWDFGADASPATSTSSGPVTVTYSTAGYKTVTLVYNDVFGDYVTGITYTDYVNVAGAIGSVSISGNTALPDCNGHTETYSVNNTVGSNYNWTVTGGTIVSGQGSSSVSVNFPGNGGTLSVTETNTAGCVGAPATVTISCPTGIDNVGSLNNGFSVYPNPNNGNMQIACSLDKATQYSLQLLSLDGKEVYGHNGTANAGMFTENISVNYLPVGIYFLKMQIEGEMISRKVVIQ